MYKYFVSLTCYILLHPYHPFPPPHHLLIASPSTVFMEILAQRLQSSEISAKRKPCQQILPGKKCFSKRKDKE